MDEGTIERAGDGRAAALGSIVRPSVAVVIGASGGLGRALTDVLVTAGFSAVHALSRRGGDVPGAVCGRIELLDEASVASSFAAIPGEFGLVIVATGALHGPHLAPEKGWRMIDPAQMAESFAVNAIGPALVAKHALPRLARGGKAVFASLSARVGSISDNRLGGWHSYRAAKAALNMLICNFAIELRTRNPHALAVGLHPGTVDTALSRPFQRNVAEGRLFTPACSAARLLTVLDRLSPADSGGCFAWDGERIAS